MDFQMLSDDVFSLFIGKVGNVFVHFKVFTQHL